MKKNQRVRSAKDFQGIIDKGSKIHSKYFIIYYLNTNTGYNRIGISVGKKILKLAVDRNYEKRVLREIISSIYSKMVGSHDFIIIMRQSAINLSYDQKLIKVVEILKKGQLLEE